MIYTFSDIHNRNWVIEKVQKMVLDKKITEEDKIIFLGDYFDSWRDSTTINAATAHLLKQSFTFFKENNVDAIFLLGNHDISYISPHNFHKCSGYSYKKELVINNILTKEDWSNLLPIHIVELSDSRLIFSHAGVSSEFSPQDYKLSYRVNQDYKTALEGNFDSYNIISAVSGVSGGPHNKSGLLWARIGLDFHPTKGVHQIFGHTIHEIPKVVAIKNDNKHYIKNATGKFNLKDFESFNLDIDCDNAYYCVIDIKEETVEIKEFNT